MVSIIIPIYNAARYLDACLESCLSQTYSDFEIIAVNDGSTDDSKAILEKYIQKDSRIILVNKENGGLPRAREAGIAKAQGEYIFFLDSDDTMTSDALEVLWNGAQTSGCDMIIGQVVSVLESGKIIANYANKCIYPESEHALLCGLLTKSILPSLCGRLIRRSLFENIVLPYEYTIGEDIITNLKIVKARNPTFSFVNQKIYDYILRPNSMLNTNTVATANKRMKYMIWVFEYLKTVENTEELENCTAQFFIEEYFSFLRDGGTECPTELKNLIHKRYLKNKWAVSQIASWRLILVKAYKLNPIFGNIARQILVSIRKITR